MSYELARASSLKALLVVVVLGASALSLLGIAATAAADGAGTGTQDSFQWYAATGPTTVHVPAYSATPGIPAGWTFTQSATVSLTNDAPGSWGFALGTSSNVDRCIFSTCGGGAGGTETVQAFPSSLSDLSSGTVTCNGSGSYDTPYALANSTLYLPTAATVHVDSLSDDGMAIYYSPSGSQSWSSLLGGGWATGYTPASLTLPAGYYTIAVAWSNSCDQGQAAVQFSSLPTGAYFSTAAPPPSAPSSSPPVPTLNACEVEGLKACYTSFLVFATSQTGATVTLTATAAGAPALASGTNGIPVVGGICALPVNLTVFGCLTGETGQFVVVSGVAYAYTVKFADGTYVTGTVPAVAPWTVQVVRVA